MTTLPQDVEADLRRRIFELEQRLEQSFADQAVIAIENARLFNETQEALERQTATADILKVIASSPADVQPVFEAIVNSAASLFQPCAATITTLKDGTLHWNATAALLPGFDIARARAIYPIPFDPERSPSARAILGRQVIEIPDIESPDTPEFTRKAATAGGFRSVTFVPLVDRDQGIGTIIFTHPQAGFKFTDKQLALVQTFADQAVIAIKNTRLFNEVQAKTRDLEESLQQQTATAEVLKVIGRSAFDLDQVFETVVESSVRLCAADRAIIFRFDGEVLRIANVFNAPEKLKEWMEQNPIRPGRYSVAARVALERRAVQVEDVRADPEHTYGAKEVEPFRTVLGVPMLKGNDLLGVIIVYHHEVRPFTEKQILLVSTFAEQAAIAIENVRLFEEVQARTRELSESLQQQTATADVLKVISRSAFDLQAVLHTLVESAARLCDADQGTITRQKGGKFYRVESFGHSGEFMDYVRDIPVGLDRGSASGRALLAGDVVHIVDVLTDPEYTFKEAQRLSGLRTCLGVPVLREGAAVGVLSLTRSEVRPFSDKQIELVKTFADQAAIAIENARLFDEVQAKTRDLEESLQFQTATSDVLKVISRSPDALQPVLDVIVGTSRKLCGSDASTIFLLRDDKFHVAAISGTLPRHLDHMRANPFTINERGSTLARVAREKRTLHYANVMDDPELREGLTGLGGPRALLSVPLMKDGNVIGVIVLRQSHLRPFTERQIQAIETFADQAVIAISNVSLFDEVQAKTRDLEESLQQQTATADVLKVISRSAFDLQSVLNTLTESAARLCSADSAAIARKGADGGYYHASRFNFPADWERVSYSVRLGPERGSLVGRVLLARSAVQINDVLADPEYTYAEQQRAGNYRTLLGVPLLRSGEPIGVLFLCRTTVEPFSDTQIELVQTFADQAVIAIENARLFDEVQAKTRDLEEALRYQTGSANILNVIASSPTDVQPALQAIAESACELCSAYDALVRLRNDDKLDYCAHYGPIPASQISLPINRHWSGGLAVIERRPIHIHDVLSSEGDAFPEAQERAKSFGNRTILAVPLLREGESIGAIVIRRMEVNPFSDKQIALLETFADQAVIAIGNVRLFEEVQARTRELAKSLEDLRTAQDRLIQTEKLASLGQLTAGIAHEIKNPLNFVNNFAALSVELTDELKDVLKPAVLDETMRAEVNELTGTLKENLGKVVQHGKRADSIVKNMLLHSREGSGEHRPADVNALVDESLNLAYHGARAEKPQFNVTLQRNFDPEAGMIEVFPQEITRVLLNLISNGFYAVSKRKVEGGGSDFAPLVTATTTGNADHVEIRIRDNGTGISPHVKEKMFNPFFTTKPSGEGTGLGLSMSHDIIVKQHGGTIYVDTEPGQFTEFTIILPRRSSQSNKIRG